MFHGTFWKALRVVLVVGLVGITATLSADTHIHTGVDQRYHVGDEGTAAATCLPITLSCEGGDVGLGTTPFPYIVQAPPGFQWDSTVTPTIGNYQGGLPSTGYVGGITFPPVGTAPVTHPYLQVALTHAFTPGYNFQISGAAFSNLVVNTPAVPLTASVNGGANFSYGDGPSPTPGSVRVAANPTASISPAQPALSPGGSAVAVNPITIQDAASNMGIWASTGIQISIPAGKGVSWANVTTLTSTGTASVSPMVTYTNNSPGDGGKLTAVLTVISDFTTSQATTLQGFQFNVLASAADNPGFNLNINVGGAANTATSHATCGPISISGTPKISSTASQTFTVGDLPASTGTITVTETSGTPKIVATKHLRIVIPPGLAMTWDPTTLGAISAPVTAGLGGPGTGVLTLPPTIVTTNTAGDTLDFLVSTSFASSDSAAITGARFAGFTASSPPGHLLLAVSGDTFNPVPTDLRTRAIGKPTFTSLADQDFLQSPPGPATVAMQQITITDDATTPRLTSGAAINIQIPTGFTMAWNNDPPGTAVLGGKLAGAAVSYASVHQPFDTLVLTPTTTFGAGGSGTVSGLNFAIGTTTSLPAKMHLFLSTTDPTSTALADGHTITVGGRPTVTSGSNQTFTVNDPTTPANLIQITDSPSSASILAGNTLQVVIPAGLNFVWDTSVTTPTVNGTARTKVTTPFSYSVDAKTLKIPVNTNFATSDTLTLNGLNFMTFSASSLPAGLEVTVTATGPVAATDPFTKAVGAPTIASAANQSFGILDPSTQAQTITITDDPNTPRLLVGSTIQVWIPSALNLTWDSGFVPVVALTGVSGGLGAPSFTNGNKTLQIPVTTSFAAGAGQGLTVTGAHFNNFSAASPASSLEFFINGQVPPALPNAFDSTTIQIGARPNVTSVVTEDLNGNGSIDHLVVTFDKAIQSTTSVTSGTGFTCAGYPIIGGAVVGNVVTFALREKGVGDTGATPVLTYNPAVGNLVDVANGLGLISAIPPTQDGAAPVIIGFSAVDKNGNGFLDQVVFTYSEPIAPGPEDITNWTLIDANGTTNLLAGLPNSAIMVSGNQVTITLADNSGTDGTPRYRYQWNGLATGHIEDGSVPPNGAAVQTNNHPPVAVAGAPLTVLPTRVTLDGSASSDPDNQPVSYSWSQVGTTPAVVTLTGATTARPTVLLITPGMYTFQLAVSDGLDTSTTTTTVTVLNSAPTAVAILNQVINISGSTTVTLYGFLSSDVDGDSPLTYTWTQVSGPAVTLTTFPPDAQFTTSTAGVYVFQLKVADASGNSTTDQVMIRINSGAQIVPTANAGSGQVGTVGTTMTLDGRSSTTSNLPISPAKSVPLQYSWTPSFLLTGATTATPTFTPPAPGLYTFQLVVTDITNGVTSAPSTVTVLAHVIGNLPPTSLAAKGSPFGYPVVGDLVTLDGTGSSDPEGAPLQYAWSQTAGPSTFVSGLSTAQPTFTPVFSGTYTFQLTVSDGVQQGFPSEVTFQVLPTAATPPVFVAPTLTSAVDPTTGHVITNGATAITLFGAPVPSPPGSQPFSDWWWEQTLGPAVPFNEGFTGDNPPSGTVSFTPPVPGRYQFKFTPFNYGNHLRSSGTVDIVVDIPTGIGSAPIANAGAPQSAIAGQQVSLDGTQSALGATPVTGTLTYTWTQISGPNVALSNPTAASPSFTPPAAGIYVFSLVVHDGSVDTAPSTVKVTVTSPAAGGSGGGGGGGGGCGSLGLEPLLVLGAVSALMAGIRRRSRRA